MSTTSFAIPFGPTRQPGEALQAPVVFFDDFIGAYFAQDDELANESTPAGQFAETANLGVWLLSQATVGVTSVAPVDDADGGWVAFTTPANADDAVNAQVNGTAFLLEEGRKLWFDIRLKTVTTTGDMFVGIAIPTVDAHGTRPAGNIGFTLTDTADIQYSTGDATTQTASVDTGVDIVAATMTNLSFEYDGRDTVSFYVDGVFTKKTTTTVPKGLVMSPVICIESSTAAAAEVLTVDYIMVVNERA